MPISSDIAAVIDCETGSGNREFGFGTGACWFAENGKFLMNSVMRAAAGALAVAAMNAGAHADDFSGLYGGVETAVDVSDRSVLVGGVVGYRMEPVPNIVVGVEGSYGSHVEGTRDLEESIRDFGGQWTVSGIAGVILGDDNLLYGSIGYMNVDYDTVGLIGSTNTDDLLLGAGFEHKLSDLLSFRVGGDYASPAGQETVRVKASLLVTF